MSDQMISSG